MCDAPALAALTPDQKRFLLEAALLLRDLGRLDEAEEALRALRPLVDDRAVPTLFMATVALQRGRIEAAEDYVAEALRLRPGWGLARGVAAQVAIAARDLERARRLLGEPSPSDGAGVTTSARTLTESLTTLTDELTAPAGAGGD